MHFRRQQEWLSHSRWFTPGAMGTLGAGLGPATATGANSTNPMSIPIAPGRAIGGSSGDAVAAGPAAAAAAALSNSSAVAGVQPQNTDCQSLVACNWPARPASASNRAASSPPWQCAARPVPSRARKNRRARYRIGVRLPVLLLDIVRPSQAYLDACLVSEVRRVSGWRWRNRT